MPSATTPRRIESLRFSFFLSIQQPILRDDGEKESQRDQAEHESSLRVLAHRLPILGGVSKLW
jgi:hypothetical protein